MRSLLLAIALVLALPTVASAQACAPGLVPQGDMAGVYRSFEAQIQVTVYPCGGIDVLWSNEYGTHQATYLTEEHLDGGGFIARIYEPDPYVRSLDGRNVVAVKPAEPGWVQVITIGPFADNARIYRLQKVG